jgi:RNA polymerase sigma factor (sigma-70 family)
MKNTDLTEQIISMNRTLTLFTHRFTRDKEESLDLVQDTMLKALLYKSKFKEETNLKGWLFTIMRNTFINNYRRLKREKTLHDSTNDLYYLNIEDNHTFNCPDTRIEYKDIWQKIEDLKEEFLTPFKMHTSGYRYHEIAEHLNIPIGTVKNRIFHARKEIQKKLSGY